MSSVWSRVHLISCTVWGKRYPGVIPKLGHLWYDLERGKKGRRIHPFFVGCVTIWEVTYKEGIMTWGCLCCLMLSRCATSNKKLCFQELGSKNEQGVHSSSEQHSAVPQQCQPGERAVWCCWGCGVPVCNPCSGAEERWTMENFTCWLHHTYFCLISDS